MRRLHSLLAIALLLFAGAQQQRSYVDWYEQMVAAFREGDHATMAEAASGALRLRPRFPPMLVNLALAHALMGDSERALDLLHGVAEMDLAYPIAEGEQFASLAASPRFQEIVARMSDSSLPLGDADVAFTLARKDFFPEGLAVDGTTGDFFVGSVRFGDIVRIDATGDPQAFAGLPWSVLGMKVDGQRGLLWVAISGMEQTADLEEEKLGRAGVAALALTDGSLRGEYLLPRGSGDRVVGDLVVAADGSVFASDSIGGGVWVLRPGTDEVTELLPDGTLESPQGLDLADDGALYVAAYSGGIYRVDTASREVQWLEGPEEVTTYGIDGLYFDGADLIAVQNGISPHRVVRLHLDRAGATVTGAQVLLRADPRFGEPTLGAVVGDNFYLVANSPWAEFADPSQLPDASSLPVPTILRLPLSR